MLAQPLDDLTLPPVVDSADGRSVASAIARMLDAGQRLMSRRLEWFRVRATNDVSRIMRVAGLGVLGMLVITVGWMLAMFGATMALQPWIPQPIALALLAVIHVGVGAGLVRKAARALKQGVATPMELEQATDELTALPSEQSTSDHDHEEPSVISRRPTRHGSPSRNRSQPTGAV